MAEPRATAALLKLLGDAKWPVRLHAARAMAKPRYAAQAAEVARHLTDSHWRVREAVAHCLPAFGSDGLHLMFRQLLLGSDRYGAEQIAEEIEKAGLLPALLGEFSSTTSRERLPVVDHLARLAGIDVQILAYLKSLREAETTVASGHGETVEPATAFSDPPDT